MAIPTVIRKFSGRDCVRASVDALATIFLGASTGGYNPLVPIKWARKNSRISSYSNNSFERPGPVPKEDLAFLFFVM
jgi:hypothetical protein